MNKALQKPAVDPDQLYLPGLQFMAVANAPSKTQKRKISRMDEGLFPVILNRALNAENLAFATYAIMTATAQQGTVTLAKLSLIVGHSYHAVRNQVQRTPWFEQVQGEHLSSVRLLPEGLKKINRIAARLAAPNL